MILSPINSKRFSVSVTITYLLAVLVITIGVRSYDPESQVALNPFHEYEAIIRIFREGFERGGVSRGFRRLWIYRHAVETVLLNVLLFVPLGYLIPIVSRFFHSGWKVLLLGFLFSLLIETVQLITRLGWFDGSDLLHNTLGALIGYWIYCRWLREKTT